MPSKIGTFIADIKLGMDNSETARRGHSHIFTLSKSRNLTVSSRSDYVCVSCSRPVGELGANFCELGPRFQPIRGGSVLASGHSSGDDSCDDGPFANHCARSTSNRAGVTLASFAQQRKTTLTVLNQSLYPGGCVSCYDTCLNFPA